ncbi:Uncharacterised protein [Vibrio cholerae]|nr:Uncharacterised protein [Vibrio cholerae]
MDRLIYSLLLLDQIKTLLADQVNGRMELDLMA